MASCAGILNRFYQQVGMRGRVRGVAGDAAVVVGRRSVCSGLDHGCLDVLVAASAQEPGCGTQKRLDLARVGLMARCAVTVDGRLVGGSSGRRFKTHVVTVCTEFLWRCRKKSGLLRGVRHMAEIAVSTSEWLMQSDLLVRLQ